MILSLLLAGMGTAATAQNINLPIIQTKYTADPAPYVHNDTVYLYTTHDEDGAEGFLMKDWLLYTSTDMVNWQDRGAVASLKDFKWFKGENGAWAEQVIERNGNGTCIVLSMVMASECWWQIIHTDRLGILSENLWHGRATGSTSTLPYG